MSKRYNTNLDKKEILNALEFFESSEDPNFINPFEIKDLMDKLELQEKMGFIYNLINELCSNREIRRKGGLTKDEFMKFLEDKVNDIDTKDGIHNLYDVFTNSKDETLPMTTFCRTAREIGDNEKDQELKELLENADMTGKELNFDEFYEIMKNDGDKNSKKYQPKTTNTYSGKYSRKNYGRKEEEEEPKEEKDIGRYTYKNRKPNENNNSNLENESRNPYSYKRVKPEQTKNSRYEKPSPVEEENVPKQPDYESRRAKYGKGKEGNFVRIIRKTEVNEDPNDGEERIEKKIVVAEIITTEKEIEEQPNEARYKYKNYRDNKNEDEGTSKHYSYKVNRNIYTKEKKSDEKNENNSNDGSDSKRYHRRYRASNRANEPKNENNNVTYSRYRRKV